MNKIVKLLIFIFAFCCIVSKTYSKNDTTNSNNEILIKFKPDVLFQNFKFISKKSSSLDSTINFDNISKNDEKLKTKISQIEGER